MSASDKLRKLDELEALAELGGGRERIEDQHKKGKLTARERISLLLDEGSFVEIDKMVTHRCVDFGMDRIKIPGDGVVTGYGRINGRLVFVFAHDFTVFGGSLSEMLERKVAKIMEQAMKVGAPIVGLNDSGGARIQEGVMGLAAVSEVFYRTTLASGLVPQISAIMGPCAGASVYAPAMTDFVIMVNKTSQMFITGPDVVKAAIGQEVSFEELGGANVHAQESGVADFVVESEPEAIELIRKLLSFLPQNNSEEPPLIESEDNPTRPVKELDHIVPADPNKSYDMKEIISAVADGGDFLETHASWAPNIITGFCRFDSHSAGVVANQPQHLAGVLDIASSNKAARFVRFCDVFNIPIVTFVDVPGYLPGTEQEHNGIIKHGCKLLFAYCAATVPKVTVITRKAYGGAYCAMGSKYSRADINYAWPSAEIAVMGPEGAINIIFRKQLEEATDKEELRKRLIAEYREKFANPYVAAERGIIDAVIRPVETRVMIIQALKALSSKREFRPPKKHINVQL